jgi:hypothetical protein
MARQDDTLIGIKLSGSARGLLRAVLSRAKESKGARTQI